MNTVDAGKAERLYHLDDPQRNPSIRRCAWLTNAPKRVQEKGGERTGPRATAAYDMSTISNLERRVRSLGWKTLPIMVSAAGPIMPRKTWEAEQTGKAVPCGPGDGYHSSLCLVRRRLSARCNNVGQPSGGFELSCPDNPRMNRPNHEDVKA